MIDLNHPAVEAAATSYARTSPARTDALEDMSAARREQFLRRAHQALTAALPHLTADDLRDTPAGRALLAEGWDRGSADNDRVWAHAYDGHDIDPDSPYYECQTCHVTNPYEETPNE